MEDGDEAIPEALSPPQGFLLGYFRLARTAATWQSPSAPNSASSRDRDQFDCLPEIAGARSDNSAALETTPWILEQPNGERPEDHAADVSQISHAP